jgi:methylphosphotriester-DNA--protein-cysteine methyltransferase
VPGKGVDPVELYTFRAFGRVRALGDRAVGRSCRSCARRSGASPLISWRRANTPITFELQLQGLRLERAKELLQTTQLAVGQVQRLSGFPTRGHFHRVFKADHSRGESKRLSALMVERKPPRVQR